jgi:hypothetical protein
VTPALGDRAILRELFDWRWSGGTWGITLDGASSGTSRFGSTEWASLNTPSIDAITEFSVDTNGFKAESGRAQGGLLAFSSKIRGKQSITARRASLAAAAPLSACETISRQRPVSSSSTILAGRLVVRFGFPEALQWNKQDLLFHFG